MNSHAARLTVHLPDAASLERVLGDAPVTLGREAGCDIAVPHASVSREHARIARGADGVWRITDLASKNGVRVDGVRVAEAVLAERTWFALGDVFCEFEPIDAAAASRWSERARTRRHSSAALSQTLSLAHGIQALLDDTLRGIVELAECRRGCILVGASQATLRLAAWHALDPEALGGREFSGSRSAVERAMRERRAVFFSDHRDRAWLRGQASVVAQGIRALACLPLMHGGVLHGVAYVDTDEDAKTFTDLDADLLTAFAERATAALALADLERGIAQVEAHLGAASPSGFWPAAAAGATRA